MPEASPKVENEKSEKTPEQVAAATRACLAAGDRPALEALLARLSTYPDRGLRFYNRGVSGNKVPDLQQRWADDTLALKPDVLSILVGVNDFWHKLSHGYTGTVEDYERQYAARLS